MIDNFPAACKFVIHGRGGWAGEAGADPRNPGGLVCAKGDPGGWTKWGITRATYSRFLGRPASVSEMRALTEPVAESIYLKFFWRPAGCDQIAAGVDLLAFDIAVNSGVGRAHALLQEVGGGAPAQRIEALHQARLRWWHRLPTWARFGVGWTRRETAARQAALDLLNGKLSP